MIIIDKPYITQDDQHAYLHAKTYISDDTAQAWVAFSEKLPFLFWRTHVDYPPKKWRENDYDLWFRVPKEYGKYLTDEVADAFLVAMIYYAMASGSDIECKAPISERLYYGITSHVIPLLCTDENGYRRITIKAETTDHDFSEARINGTGMSCGVDSLYTLQKYNDPSLSANFKLGALAYMNMGAVFHPKMTERKEYSLEEFYEITNKMADEKNENAQVVGNLANLPVIYIVSNMDEDFYRGGYGNTCLYRNFSCALSLSKYFKKYYCSPAGWPNFYDPTLMEGSEHYELLLCNFLSSDSVEFVFADECTRYEKTVALSTDPIAQKHLDVCFNFNNCGVCSKCYRTLLTLDLQNALDSFRDCFPIDNYKRNRVKAYTWLLQTARRNSVVDNVIFANDLKRRAEQKGVIPFAARIRVIPYKIAYYTGTFILGKEGFYRLIKWFDATKRNIRKR